MKTSSSAYSIATAQNGAGQNANSSATNTKKGLKAIRPVFKAGSSNVYDPKAGLSLIIPSEFKIFQSNGKAWLGGSTDGQYYLHIERFSRAIEQLPTILAEGDLDLYLCSVKPIEAIGADIRGVEVSGSLAGQAITGYLAVINFSETLSYQVLIAGEQGHKADRLKSMVLEVIGRIAIAREAA